jgi:gluconokinase
MTGESTLVVMGVSACGKSTLAAALAARRGVEYLDADGLHAAANIRKMSEGIALDDADRWPWLDLVGARMRSGEGIVVACSALRRIYRDRLRRSAPDVVFVHLQGDRQRLLRRAQERPDHFMPASLLDSQLAALEPLGVDERGLVVDIDVPTHRACDDVEAVLGKVALSSSTP